MYAHLWSALYSPKVSKSTFPDRSPDLSEVGNTSDDVAVVETPLRNFFARLCLRATSSCCAFSLQHDPRQTACLGDFFRLRGARVLVASKKGGENLAARRSAFLRFSSAFACSAAIFACSSARFAAAASASSWAAVFGGGGGGAFGACVGFAAGAAALVSTFFVVSASLVSAFFVASAALVSALFVVSFGAFGGAFGGAVGGAAGGDAAFVSIFVLAAGGGGAFFGGAAPFGLAAPAGTRSGETTGRWEQLSHRYRQS